jgi:hypothetical protein
LSVDVGILEHMFESQSCDQTVAGDAIDYGYVEPLAPGAVDPVRLAALVAGLDAGGEPLDPAEFALYGPEPGVDPAKLFRPSEAAGMQVVPRNGSGTVDGPLEPAVLVPVRAPGLEGMPPGPALAGALEAADLSAMGAYELVEAIAAWQRIASWATARQATAIAELSRRVEMRPLAGGRQIESMSSQRITAMEVAARLCLTRPAGRTSWVDRCVWSRRCPARMPPWPMGGSTSGGPRSSPTSCAGRSPRWRGESKPTCSAGPIG